MPQFDESLVEEVAGALYEATGYCTDYYTMQQAAPATIAVVLAWQERRRYAEAQGFFAGLTPEQQMRAINYRGEDC